VKEWISIMDVAVSPNGKYVAYGTFGGDVHVLDAATANRKWHSKKDERRGHFESIDITPDSRLLAGAGSDNKVIFWDLETGVVLHELDNLRDYVTVVAFSPAGQLFAMGYGGTGHEFTAPASIEVFRWKLEQTEGKTTVELTRVHEFPDLVGRVKSMAFSRDGQLLAAGCHGPLVRLWNLETGQALPSLMGHGRIVNAIAFSPVSPRILASATTFDASPSSTGEVILWDLDSGKSEMIEGHGGETEDLCFSPDGSLLATCGLDRIIRIWDVHELEPIDTIRGHSGAVHGVSFTPDGRTLVSCSTDTTVRFWDLSQRPHSSRIRAHRHYVYGLDFDHTGRHLVTTGIGTPNAEVQQWDTSSGKPVGNAMTSAVHFSYDVDVSPDGRTIAVSGGQWPDNGRDGELSLWDVDTGRKRRTLVRGPLIWAAEFSPVSKQIVGTIKDRLAFWDIETGDQQAEWPSGQGDVRSLAWSADGRFIASCSNSKEAAVKLWDASTKECLWTFQHDKHDEHTFTIVSFSRDSRLLAASGFMNDILLWRISADGKQVTPYAVLKGHTDVVWGLDFTPDSRRLASSSKDATVRLWNVETGSELTAMRDFIGWCWPCKFSPEGNTLAVGYGGFSWNGWIRLYRAANRNDVERPR
jgi:WD40 repeat protein